MSAAADVPARGRLSSPKLRPWHLDRAGRRLRPPVHPAAGRSTTRSRPPASTPWPTAPSPSAGRRDRVTIIDDDLGKSGQSIEGRPGFQRLLAEVALDHVGLILGLEMSRLARSCKDWHQLLELCARFRVLLADADGVYDPTDHNDRLLLGLHGIMSEAELHVLKQRMYQGKLNKARRGELFGTAADRLRPARRRRVGDRPRRAGPGRRPADLRPVRPRGHAARPAPLPGPPPASASRSAPPAARTGASWSGGGRTGRRCRTCCTTRATPGPTGSGHRPVDPRRKQPGRPATGKLIRRPEECLVLIRDRLPAYITWDRFEANQERLDAEPQPAERRRAPRGTGRRCWPGWCAAGGAGGG